MYGPGFHAAAWRSNRPRREHRLRGFETRAASDLLRIAPRGASGGRLPEPVWAAGNGASVPGERCGDTNSFRLPTWPGTGRRAGCSSAERGRLRPVHHPP